jgi:C-methyltransferase
MTVATPPAALPSLSARVKLYQIGQGFAVLSFLQAAVDLGLADALGDEPQDAQELASAVAADPDALNRLLRALSCHGVFERIGDQSYRHTELSLMLRSDAPWGAPAVIRFGWMHVPLTVLQHTAEAVRTGKAVFPKLFGTDAQKYFVVDDPEAGGIFNRAMVANTVLLNNAPALVEGLNLTGTETVMDVGGGLGKLLIELLNRHPNLSGVLLELEQVVGDADPSLREGGSLADRCRVVAGDCRESLPGGADVYLFKHMMYMFDDETVVRSLRNAAEAGAPGARVIVADMLLDTGGPFEEIGASVDLLMVLMGGGKRRSVGEFAELFARAGLEFAGASPIEGDQSCLLEGRVQR